MAYHCHRPESLAVAGKQIWWIKQTNGKSLKKEWKRKEPENRANQSNPRRNKEEIVVQRLSADVTGKVQKYLRIGPREFVQVGFDDDELTTEKALCTTNRK